MFANTPLRRITNITRPRNKRETRFEGEYLLAGLPEDKKQFAGDGSAAAAGIRKTKNL